MRRGVLAGLIVAAAIGGSIAFASADGIWEPEWRIDQPVFTGGGSAIIAPGNDTRANLLLLLADARGAIVRHPRALPARTPEIQLSWSQMEDRTLPTATDEYAGIYDTNDRTRCQTASSGAEEYAAAVRQSDVPAAEKQALIDARTKAVVDCNNLKVTMDVPAVTSPAARAFADYAVAAGQFYEGRFGEARAGFVGLENSSNHWLRETARYMAARTALNDAQAGSINEYGDLAAVADRDMAKIAIAATAFNSYLQAYPAGLYADSARGLMRRVHWLEGNESALAADYSAMKPAPATAAFFANEVDSRLQFGGIPYRDPILLAVDDLKRLRRPVDAEGDRSSCCGPVLTRAELEKQRPIFANDKNLFDFLLATEAWYGRKDPRDVLKLIPDASHQQRFSYLQFSRQMLRWMALQALGDPNARQFLLDLLPGAVQPYQRGSVELALAIQYEKSGQLDRVFAPDSQVRVPLFRNLLLERTAGIDLLRRQATNPAVSRSERDTALYILLAKELQHGLFSDFLTDVARVPAGAPSNTSYWTADYADVDNPDDYRAPPTGVFITGSAGETGCPPLADTARALAAQPNAIRPRLCFAEFLRVNGFDWSLIDDPLASGLASTPSLFPGKRISRLEIYKSIMNDPAASADDRAYALNRAIRCYQPVGNNSCGGTEISVDTRKAWFRRLKTTYAKSPWAEELEYYW